MSNSEDNLIKAFEKTLNLHGYGFQFSALDLAEKLAYQRLSHWQRPVIEFPVEIQGKGTRIDIVFQHKTEPIYMLVECKRVNPALSNWCFIKAPFPPKNFRLANLMYETLLRSKSGYTSTTVEQISGAREVFHIGLEVKSDQKGDPIGGKREAIEDAATQVLRGQNGFIEFVSQRPEILPDRSKISFLPVIFTTAQLYFSRVNLSSSSLENGKVDLSEHSLEKIDWLLYDYNQSPGLKHPVSPDERDSKLTNILYNEYTRSIAVVSVDGISDFLISTSRYWQ